MENENFDADLNNRIKQIFDDYDDGRANDGWNLLRKKYPKKNRRKYFFWWIATILLLTALLIWFFQFETNQPKTVKIVKQSKSDLAKIQAEVHSFSNKSTVKTDSLYSDSTEKVRIKTAFGFPQNQKSLRRKTSIINQNQTDSSQKIYSDNTVFTDTKSNLTDDPDYQKQVSNLAKADSVVQEKSQVKIQKQDSSLKSVLKKDLVKTASVKNAAQKKSKFGFSLFAGPQLNFANGSNTLFGFGAGITTDFQLSKKLKLASGIGLIQNKLSYQNNLSNNNSYASIPANTTQNSSTGATSSNASLKSLDASLLQLDIPVNLTYQILPGKNSIAVLAGLSSGTFAKETYQYNYVNAADDSKTTKSFQNFYLLKTLNVAAQFSLPIRKYNLQVEPFVKVPLANMSTQQLKYGSAGVNLKFNIQTLKK